ncbi:hypothetical protein SAY87_001532 [Trapa incisa]|uniref:Uncharacterized protein n=1 Tax=Trapa incisa TaxID=236973 RepID=A0AAN7GDQ0_9MYRT|nr:hypothetical protein SAY87_001532 [Trapa incisa]
MEQIIGAESGNQSQKDIDAILKAKLQTIVEEPETTECCRTPPMRRVLVIKKGMKVKKLGQIPLPHFTLKGSYGLFMASFAWKDGFGGILQY